MAERINERVNSISQTQYLKLSKELIENERAIHKVTADLAQLRGIKAGILKRAENDGADKEAMQFLLKLLKKHPDDDDRSRLLENAYKYASWTDVPMWAAPTDQKPQGTLIVDPEEVQAAKAEFRVEAAKGQGAVAAYDGAAESLNPHTPGSEEFAAWVVGFKAASDDMFERAKKAPPKVAKPPKVASTGRRPGRPPNAAKEGAAPAAPKPPKAPKRAAKGAAPAPASPLDDGKAEAGPVTSPLH